MGLLKTAGVVVLRPHASGEDEMGEPVVEWSREAVDGVLPQPGETSDLGEDRPHGDRASATFHFPKGYGESLRGCLVEYAGRTWAVQGDPSPYLEGNVPGAFSMPVEAVAVDG